MICLMAYAERWMWGVGAEVVEVVEVGRLMMMLEM